MKKILLFLIIFLFLSGLFLYTYLYTYTIITNSRNNTNSVPAKRRLCSLEAKLCPDGTSVGRTGPNCEFTPCKEVGTTKIYLNFLTPATGSVGQKVIINGNGFTSENNIVKFGNGYIYGTTLVDEQSLEFIIPDGYDLCPPQQKMCPMGYPKLRPGAHNVSVLNSNGESNILQFEVVE